MILLHSDNDLLIENLNIWSVVEYLESFQGSDPGPLVDPGSPFQVSGYLIAFSQAWNVLVSVPCSQNWIEN